MKGDERQTLQVAAILGPETSAQERPREAGEDRAKALGIFAAQVKTGKTHGLAGLLMVAEKSAVALGQFLEAIAHPETLGQVKPTVKHHAVARNTQVQMADTGL